MTTHRAHRIADGEYEYRGYTITRDDSVSDGYRGRWKTDGRTNCSGTTLRDVKANIDRRIQELEARHTRQREELREQALRVQQDAPIEKVKATVTLDSVYACRPCQAGWYRFSKFFRYERPKHPDEPISLVECFDSNSISDVVWALRVVREDIFAVLPKVALEFLALAVHAERSAHRVAGARHAGYLAGIRRCVAMAIYTARTVLNGVNSHRPSRRLYTSVLGVLDEAGCAARLARIVTGNNTVEAALAFRDSVKDILRKYFEE